MYRSDEHRKMTEDFVKSVKDNRYAESTVYKKILDSHYMIRESLPGSSAAEKARNLMRDIGATVTNTTTSGLVWDSRVVIPIGTKFRTGLPDSGSSIYTLVSVKDNNYCTILSQNAPKGSTGTNYRISDLNQCFKTFAWTILEATPEHYKVTGKPPKDVIKFTSANGISGALNLNLTDASNYNVGVFYIGPTSNCQLGVLGSAINMLTYIKNPDDLKRAFKQITIKTSKRMILMDIKTRDVIQLTSKLPAGSIIINSRYTSSNNSDMSIVLVNTSKW